MRAAGASVKSRKANQRAGARRTPYGAPAAERAAAAASAEPLDEQIAAAKQPRVRQREQKPVKAGAKGTEKLDASLTRKIMSSALEQQQEDEMEEEEENQQASLDAARAVAAIADEDDDAEVSGGEDDMGMLSEGDEKEEEEYRRSGNGADFELSAEDERALTLLMSDASRPRRTLGDIISEKLKEQERELAEEQGRPIIDKKVYEVYKGVGKLLHTYKIGKLPKAFKLLPVLNNWEELVFVTRPDEWSPNAMRVAVRLFASGLNSRLAQRFYSVVLLPCIRDAMHSQKKLNFHHYLALKKALYKPAAFYKGFVLPLCESGDCSLKEAVIVSSVLAKVSVPMLHSAAALMKLAQMKYSGAVTIFMRVLIDKKYSLPFKVVDAVAAHFARFMNDQRRMVVLWHQTLLSFVQRYKADLTKEQKDMLRALIKVHSHPIITSLIRMELDNSTCRGDHADPSMERVLHAQFVMATGTSPMVGIAPAFPSKK
eukprot:TRINITY_DN17951_c0_g1_i1.p1 TRINITY_DN17951_c0_g1~~TRINITY_DN17951_c0_g1_i1.p1  ORF type:complete len:497 (-),score=164.11 TRINITY_DN17951_c0_g1_i1:32-1489(-)